MLYKEALSTKQLNKNLLQNELAISKLKQGVEAILPVMVITSGNKTLSVPFNEMAYWFLSDGLVTVVLKGGKKITTNYTSFTPVLA